MVTNKARIGVRICMVGIWIGIIFFLIYASTIWSLHSGRKSINVFAWSGFFDLQYIAQFERQTGIKVNISYYESNEELLVKLRTSKNMGYDLIVPSDYAVHTLRKDGFLKKLDKSKMPFYKHINPLLLGHYYDSGNNYSVPIEWAIFGIGVDQDFYKKHALEPSWSIIFEPRSIKSNIIMINDPLVAIPLAALYLFGSLEHITAEKLERIKQLLICQRPCVEAYADFRADYYLATKNSPLAVSSSSYIWRSMQKYEHIDFVIPKEGSIVTIENCAIPVTSKKEDLVYEFMKFIFKPEIVAYNFERLSQFPTIMNVLDRLTLTDSLRELLTMSKEEFARFHFFQIDSLQKPINEQTLQEVWVAVKS